MVLKMGMYDKGWVRSVVLKENVAPCPTFTSPMSFLGLGWTSVIAGMASIFSLGMNCVQNLSITLYGMASTLSLIFFASWRSATSIILAMGSIFLASKSASEIWLSFSRASLTLFSNSMSMDGICYNMILFTVGSIRNTTSFL